MSQAVQKDVSNDLQIPTTIDSAPSVPRHTIQRVSSNLVHLSHFASDSESAVAPAACLQAPGWHNAVSHRQTQHVNPTYSSRSKDRGGRTTCYLFKRSNATEKQLFAQ
eukprot:2179846-Amphidinium_carterae.1